MGSDSHLARIKEGAAAWNRWRQLEPPVRPDLNGMSLTLAQKQWGEINGGPINLAHALLHDADLRHATLIRANLEGASLSGADLTGARLRQANLEGAVMSSVCFDDADLTDAIFTGTDVRGADLRYARNLDAEQLRAARGNAETLLPPHMTAPRSWSEASGVPRVGTEARLGVPSPKIEVGKPAVSRPGVGQLGAIAKAQVANIEAALARVPTMQAASVAAAKSEAVKAEAARNAATVHSTKAGKPAPAKPAGRSETTKPGPAKDWSATLPITDPVNVELAEVRVVKLGQPAPAAAPRFEPRLALMVGLAGLLVLAGVESLLAPRHIDAAALSGDPPAVAPAPEPAEPPQRMAVGEGAAPAPISPVRTSARAESPGSGKSAPAKELPLPAVEHAEVNPPGASPLVVEDLARKSAQPATDESVRLAFSMGAKGVQDVGVLRAPALPGGASASPVEALADPTTQVRSVLDPIPRIDLPNPPQVPRPTQAVKPTVAPATPEPPKPTQVAKAVPPEATPGAAAPAPAPGTPASVVEYLSAPQRTSDWVEVFIRDFYLSESALDEAQIRRIYSDPVDYFGQHKLDLREVARAKQRYYRIWPTRHYELVPGSIAIRWKSDTVAEATFLYRYDVSAPKRRSQSGRGRAHVTLDLGGPAGMIIREDGELLRHN